ncbi:MAG: hypothetical protein ACREQ5_29560, partial [Candidatus Dormibacteria bacterium]
MALLLNDRLFYWDYTGLAVANVAYGVYAVTQPGDATHPFILTRAADANTPAGLGSHFAYVTQGTVNAGLVIEITLAGAAIVIGTTPLAAVVVSGNSAVGAETARAQGQENFLGGAIVGAFEAAVAGVSWLWADDPQFLAGTFDVAGNPILAVTGAGKLAGSAVDALPATGYVWADESVFAAGAGVLPGVDANGNVLLAYGAAPGALDDYCPYIGTDGGVHATNNAAAMAGLDIAIASARGTIRGGPEPQGPIVTWMDDATPTGNAPLHERRKFDWRGGAYLAGLGGITKLVQVVDIGHSLTVGGTAGLLTTQPFFARGVMFAGGPKVVQSVGGVWNTPAPICDDAQIPSLAEYYEFQVSGGQGESHGGGVVQWFSAGSNLG